MSCAYRRIAAHLGVVAGINPHLVATAQDVARTKQQSDTPVTDHVREFCAAMIGPTCSTVSDRLVQVIRGTIHVLQHIPDTHAHRARLDALASILDLPSTLPPTPSVIRFLTQWFQTPIPSPLPDETPIPQRKAIIEAGLAYLRAGQSIPESWIRKLSQWKTADDIAIAWIKAGAWHPDLWSLLRASPRLETEWQQLAAAGIVFPDMKPWLQAAVRSMSSMVAWETIPFHAWELLDHPDREYGVFRTAHAILANPANPIQPTLLHIVSTSPYTTARDAESVLLAHPTIHDPRLYALLSTQPTRIGSVIRRHPQHIPFLIDTIVKDPDLAAAALTTDPSITDPRLLDILSSRPTSLAFVFAECPDLRDRLRPIITAQSESLTLAILCGAPFEDEFVDRLSAEQAVRILRRRFDITDPRLIERAMQASTDPDIAVELLRQRPELRTDPDGRPTPLAVMAAAINPWEAARFVMTHRQLFEPLVATIANEPAAARDVLCACPDIDHPALIAAVARRPWKAFDVLHARPQWSHPDLVAAVARDGAVAAKAREVRPDLADQIHHQETRWNPYAARDVLCTNPPPSLADEELEFLINRIANEPAAARDVLCARSDIDHPALIATVARHPWKAFDVLRARPQWSHPDLVAAVARDGAAAAKLIKIRPDLAPTIYRHRIFTDVWMARDALCTRALQLEDSHLPDVCRLLASQPAAARDVLCARPDIDHPTLIAAVAGDPWKALDVLIARPQWSHPDLVAKALSHPQTARRLRKERRDLSTRQSSGATPE